MNNGFLTADYITYSNGLFTFQNLSVMSLLVVNTLVSVESDVYNSRVNWRLTPYLNNNNFNGYGQYYTTTEGATSINRFSTIIVRTLIAVKNNDVFKLVVDCNKEGDNTFGSSMNGLRIRNASLIRFEYIGPY